MVSNKKMVSECLAIFIWRLFKAVLYHIAWYCENDRRIDKVLQPAVKKATGQAKAFTIPLNILSMGLNIEKNGIGKLWNFNHCS